MKNKKINLALTDETVLVTSVNADGLDVKTIIKDGYFYCYLVGMSYLPNYDEFRHNLRPGTPVSLFQEPNNSHDPHAIAVNHGKTHIGYISKKFIPFVEPCFDDDILYAEIANVSEKYIRLRVKADFRNFTHNNCADWGHLSFVIEDKKRPNALLRFIKFFAYNKDFFKLKYIPQEEYSSYFYYFYKHTADQRFNSNVADNTNEKISSRLKIKEQISCCACPDRGSTMCFAIPDCSFSGGEPSNVSLKKTKLDVFLSYSREDANLPVLNEIRKYLEENGIEYFMDTKDIIGGVNYINAIVDAIAKCRLVLFIASNNSYKSRALNELLVAHRKNKPVLSYIIDKSEMPDNVYFLVGMYNYLDSDEYDIPHCLIPAIKELLISSAKNELDYLFK